MVEKRVSVRLYAVGGRQVKAELEQIGAGGSAALGQIEASADNASRALVRMSAASAASAYRSRMLAFQLNDVFVSLASGMNPMMVFIQQGSQIAQIYGGDQGGVKGALRDVAGMARSVVTRFGPLAAAIGVGAAAVAGLRDEIQDATGVAVSFGDTLSAVAQLGAERISSALAPAVAAVAPYLASAWEAVKTGAAAAYDFVVRRASLAIAAISAFWNDGWKSVVGTIAIWLANGVDSVVWFGDRAIAIFKGAFDGIKATWKSLPDAIGDFVFQAANGLIGGVEDMINGVVKRINRFIDGLNGALALLPEWAVGEGGLSIGPLDPVDLGRIPNPFEGAAEAVGDAAADAFNAALDREYVTAPTSGMRAAGEALLAAGASSWSDYERRAAEIMGSDPSGDLLDEVARRAVENAKAREAAEQAAGRAAKSAGRAAKEAGAEAAEGGDAARSAWETAAESLAEYARKASDIGSDIGSALVSAFQSAEQAVGEFVKTGKLSISDLVKSMIADFAQLSARKFIFGPLASVMGGALGGISASVLHSGGVVGMGGAARTVPVAAFAGAQRFHSGGWPGLRPGEVPAILERGERVLSRQEARSSMSPVNVTIVAKDAQSFRAGRAQVAADIARAVGYGRRVL